MIAKAAAAEYDKNPEAAKLSETFVAGGLEAVRSLDNIVHNNDAVIGSDVASGRAISLIHDAHSRGELVVWDGIQAFLRARVLNDLRISSIRRRFFADSGASSWDSPEWRRIEADVLLSDPVVVEIAAKQKACSDALWKALDARVAGPSFPECNHATYEVRLY